MECTKVQENLSAYVDDMLSPEERARIDDHLKSCRECATALAEIKKTIEHAKSLETVEPPLWMAQKVMAKVRAEARPKKSLLQKLFYPLHVKLPIEAIATVLVLGLALYVYRDIQPAVKLAQAPIEETATQRIPKDVPLPSRPFEKRGKDEIKGRESAPVRSSEEGEKFLPASPPLEKRGEGGFEEKKAMAGKLAEEPPPSGKMVLKADRLAPSESREIAKGEEVKPPAPARSLEQAPASGAIAKDVVRHESKTAVAKEKLSYMEKKQEPLVLTIVVKDPEAAVKEIEKTLKELEGKTIRTESVEGKRIIATEIHAAKLKSLIEKLKAVGQVKERDINFEAMKGEVGVRVEIVENSEAR